jgi:hypothetical protein
MIVSPFNTSPDLGASREPEKRLVIIRKDRFRLEIYDVVSFLLPHVYAQDIWKLMFSAPEENEAAIDTIRRWLPEAGYETKTAAVELEERLKVERLDVRVAESRIAAFGGAAYGKAQKEQLKQLKTALADAKRTVRETERRLRKTNVNHARAVKLQEVFNKMAEKAGL